MESWHISDVPPFARHVVDNPPKSTSHLMWQPLQTGEQASTSQPHIWRGPHGRPGMRNYHPHEGIGGHKEWWSVVVGRGGGGEVYSDRQRRVGSRFLLSFIPRGGDAQP